MVTSRSLAAVRVLLSTFLLCSLSACTTPSANEDSPITAQEAPFAPRVAGTIARVNGDFDFVIVRCNLAPVPDSLAEIYRDGERVGLIAFRTQSTHPYYAADVLSGSPRKGDIAAYRD